MSSSLHCWEGDAVWGNCAHKRFLTEILSRKEFNKEGSYHVIGGWGDLSQWEKGEEAEGKWWYGKKEDISHSVFPTCGPWSPSSRALGSMIKFPLPPEFHYPTRCQGELDPRPERAPQSVPLAPAKLDRGTGLQLSIASVWQVYSGPCSESYSLTNIGRSIWPLVREAAGPGPLKPIEEKAERRSY